MSEQKKTLNAKAVLTDIKVGMTDAQLIRKKIAESGTDAVVAKPVDGATALATVQEMADQRGRRR